MLLQHPREVLTVIGLTMGGTLAFYTYTTYMQKFLVNTAGFEQGRRDARAHAVALFVFMLLQPLVGALSDRIGRRPVLIAFGVLGTLLHRTDPQRHRSGAAALRSAFWLVMAALVDRQRLHRDQRGGEGGAVSRSQIRALGVGLPYALTVSLFGGTAEYVALWFKKIGHESGFYWYVTACIACSLVVYVCMRDTRSTIRASTAITTGRDVDAHPGAAKA